MAARVSVEGVSPARSVAHRRRQFLNMALNDLNAAVLSLLDVPDHMRSILGDACTAIGASSAYVEMREEDCWAVKFAVGLSDDVLGRTLTPATKIAKRVKQWRNVAVVNQLGPDVVSDVRRLGGEDVQAALVAPLLIGGRVRGLMTFLGEAFDEGAEDFARKLATSVALALRAAELFEAEARRVELAEALDRINRLVHARLHPSEVLEVTLEEGRTVLCAASACVVLAEDGRWVIRHHRALDDALIGLSFDHDFSPLASYLGATKESLIIDPRTDEHFDQDLVERFGATAMLVAPIASKDTLLGAVAFALQDGAFTSAEVDFARRLAASTSLAYENAQLYQQQLEAGRLSERLSEIEELLHSTLEFDEMVQAALAEGVRALGADTAAVLFLEEDGLRVTYAEGPFPGNVIGVLTSFDQQRHGLQALETGRPVAVDDALTDARCDSAHMEQHGLLAVIAVPLVVRGEAIGNLYYNYQAVHHFTQAETDFVSRIGSSLSLALQNAQQYAAERTIAQTLQEALLALPDEVPGVRIAHVYESAALQARVGGDFYDVFELDNEMLGLVVGDVSGKGLDAAVLTALVKNTIRAHAVVKGNAPSDVLAHVNLVLLKESRPETFVTAFFGMLDRRDGRLVYCNAGHPAAVVLREDGIARRLAPNSPIAGAFANAPFSDGEAHVGVDDLLFLYTDGLTEARRGRELYGEERLFVQLARVCDTEPSEAIGRVLDDVVAFAGGQLADDVAVLAVKRVPLPNGSPVQQKLPLWSVR